MIDITASRRESARIQIDRIKTYWQEFWFELKDFHDRRCYLELGYATFLDCINKELGLSEVHVYRLIDAANVRLEIETQPGVSAAGLTERQARELKALPPDERAAIARDVDFSQVSTKQLRQVIKERSTLRLPPPKTQETADADWQKIESYAPPPYIQGNAERYVPLSFAPPPVHAEDEGFGDWFDEVADVALSAFDPAWLNYPDVTTLQVRERYAPALRERYSADWWEENRATLLLMGQLIVLLASMPS